MDDESMLWFGEYVLRGDIDTGEDIGLDIDETGDDNELLLLLLLLFDKVDCLSVSRLSPYDLAIASNDFM